MDLKAYAQIDNLQELAELNGIIVPRLRGYRLMKDEEAVPEDSIQNIIREQAIEEATYLCVSNWGKNWSHEYSKRTDAIRRRYLTYVLEEAVFAGRKVVRPTYTGIRWERIHGKRRKILKWRIRQAEKRIRDQFNMWNRYVGCEDVLYIHSRTGGDRRWENCRHTWFLGKVDDYFDRSYCDIFARLTVLPKESSDGVFRSDCV